MNIVFFTHYTALYGANRSLINLVDGLTSKGFKVFLISPAQGPITDYFNSKCYPVFIHPFQPFLKKGKTSKEETLHRLESQFNNLNILISQLLNWNIDILYTNSSVIDIGIISSKILKKPHIWHVREFGNLDYDLHPDIGYPLFQKLLCSSDGLIFISEILKDHILPVVKHQNSKVIFNGIARSNYMHEIFFNSKKTAKPLVDTFSIVGLVTKKRGSTYRYF